MSMLSQDTARRISSTCQCRRNDAWRCAVDQSLSTISCPCPCHRHALPARAAEPAELAQLRNDAERYRTLRDRPRLQRRRVVGLQVVDYEDRSEGRLLYGDELDAALDRVRHG